MSSLEYYTNLKVSYQKNAFAPLSQEITIESVLNGIRDQRLKDQISRLRYLYNKGEKETYNREKKLLPAVTFCGIFDTKRHKENLKDYNSLIVIDIDKLSDSELIEVKSKLESDKYVFTFWDSPSQKGIKGLVGIDYSFDFERNEIDLIHKVAFQKLVRHFDDSYSINLDQSGSDTTRLCFISSDAKLVLKKNLYPFKISRSDLDSFSEKKVPRNLSNVRIRALNQKDALYNPLGRNNPHNRKSIQSIYKYLEKRGLSITSTYEKWYKVAFAIANTFTFDIGEGYFLKLCRLDGEKHNEVESRNLLVSCYEYSKGEISFNTVYYYANELGYKQKNKESGNEGV